MIFWLLVIAVSFLGILMHWVSFKLGISVVIISLALFSITGLPLLPKLFSKKIKSQNKRPVRAISSLFVLILLVAAVVIIKTRFPLSSLYTEPNAPTKFESVVYPFTLKSGTQFLTHEQAVKLPAETSPQLQEAIYGKSIAPIHTNIDKGQFVDVMKTFLIENPEYRVLVLHENIAQFELEIEETIFNIPYVIHIEHFDEPPGTKTKYSVNINIINRDGLPDFDIGYKRIGILYSKLAVLIESKYNEKIYIGDKQI